jgi:hypothetical protein
VSDGFTVFKGKKPKKLMGWLTFLNKMLYIHWLQHKGSCCRAKIRRDYAQGD